MRLRTVSLFAAVLLLLGAAYTVWWNAAAHRLQAHIDGWIEAQRAAGAQVETGDRAVGGYPLRLSVAIRDARLRLAGATEIRSGEISAWAWPWSPLQINVALPAGGQVSLPGSGEAPGIEIAAGPGGGSAILATDGAIRQAEVALTDVVAGAPGGTLQTRIGRLAAEARWPDRPPASHTDVGLRTSLSATAIALPVPPPGMPGMVDSLRLDVRVQGMPPAPLTAETIGRWSADGGTVEVERLELRWGSVGAVANGTVALDGQLQPMLAASASLRGLDTVVQALTSAGRIKPNQGAIARAALGLLSQPAADGVAELTAPLTLQDGKLTLGPLPLATVPPITWPAGD